MMEALFTGNDSIDAYLKTIQDDPLVKSIFADGFREEDSGGVSPRTEKLLSATLYAEGHDDASTGGSSFVNTYQIGIIIYVSDSTRDPNKKRELVQITGIVKQVMMKLKYRSDPDTKRAAWYKSGFYQPIATRYRSLPNHRQSITVVELRNRKRTMT